MPRRYPSSSDMDAMIALLAPAVLVLLGDGMSRRRRAIVAALADRHPKDEVARTLMRLAVTGRVAEAGGKYTLAGTEEPSRT
jgi:predicted NBD/HSP70 family sugar kinase